MYQLTNRQYLWGRHNMSVLETQYLPRYYMETKYEFLNYDYLSKTCVNGSDKQWLEWEHHDRGKHQSSRILVVVLQCRRHALPGSHFSIFRILIKFLQLKSRSALKNQIYSICSDESTLWSKEPVEEIYQSWSCNHCIIPPSCTFSNLSSGRVI